jgi:hypothetical protein
VHRSNLLCRLQLHQELALDHQIRAEGIADDDPIEIDVDRLLPINS